MMRFGIEKLFRAIRRSTDEGEKVLAEAIRRAKKIDKGHERESALKAISLLLAEHGRCDEAEKLILEIETAKTDFEFPIKLSHAFSQSGHVQQGHTLMEEAERIAKTEREAANATEQFDMLMALGTVYIRIDAIQKTKSLIQEMKSTAQHVEPDCSNQFEFFDFIKTLTQGGLTREAQELIAVAPFLEREENMIRVAKTLARRGEEEQARKILLSLSQKAEIQCQKSLSSSSSSDLLVSIAQAYLEMGKRAHAHEILRKITQMLLMEVEKKGFTDSNLTAPLIRAATVFAEMGDIDEAVHGIEPLPIRESYKALISIAKAIFRMSRKEEASSVLQKAEHVATIVTDPAYPNISGQNHILREIAKTYAEIGDIENAERLIQTSYQRIEGLAETEGYHNLWGVAEAYLDVGDPAKAEAVTKSLSDIDGQGNIFEVLVRKELEKGNIEAAQKFASQIEEKFYRTRAFIFLANSLIEKGRLEEAHRALEEARRDIELVTPRMETHIQNLFSVSLAKWALKKIFDQPPIPTQT